jgi:hypothetical protein
MKPLPSTLLTTEDRWLWSAHVGFGAWERYEPKAWVKFWDTVDRRDALIMLEAMTFSDFARQYSRVILLQGYITPVAGKPMK